MTASRPVLKLLAYLFVGCLSAEMAFAQVDYSDFITSREKIGDNGRPAKPALKYRKQWALIVGIDYAEGDAYSNPQRRQIPKLANARRDAAALKDKLIHKYGYQDENVVLLLEGEATGERISRELQKLHGNDVANRTVCWCSSPDMVPNKRMSMVTSLSIPTMLSWKTDGRNRECSTFAMI